jgi:hypothetical protein
MKMKPMIVAGIAAALLSSGSAVAAADPAPDPPGPDPNSPKCWQSTEDGWMHTELVPCGWTYSSAGGWQQLPPPPGEPNP